ncbi:MAG: hypothetical protein IAF94_05545 [Pirellulaceae bacterium]|nr:hypothetical protein [Pirellulaceae bacterium]
MKPILWSLLAIFVGVVVGGIVVGLVEIPAHFIYPLPGLDMNDHEALAAHMAKAPPLVMANVALAWALGPLAGTLVACLIVRRKYVVHGLIMGVTFALLDAYNYTLFPHPLWLMVAGIVLPFLTSYAAAAIAQRLFPPKATGPQPYDMRDKNMAC